MIVGLRGGSLLASADASPAEEEVLDLAGGKVGHAIVRNLEKSVKVVFSCAMQRANRRTWL